MSSNHLVYLAWTPALISRLLTCIISCGAHLNRNKWKEVADNFFVSNSGHKDFYLSNPESYIRRVRDKFKDEYKRICMSMGWREYGGVTSNLSAKETPELGESDILMRQIVEEMTAQDQEKEKAKALQERLAAIEKDTLHKKRKIPSTPTSEDSNTQDVRSYIYITYVIYSNIFVTVIQNGQKRRKSGKNDKMGRKIFRSFNGSTNNKIGRKPY